MRLSNIFVDESGILIDLVNEMHWSLSLVLIRLPLDETCISQQAHDVIIASLLRRNDVETSFPRNNDVIIAAGVHWDYDKCLCVQLSLFCK